MKDFDKNWVSIQFKVDAKLLENCELIKKLIENENYLGDNFNHNGQTLGKIAQARVSIFPKPCM